MKLPYGNADFYRIIREGFTYVDRTAAIRDLEEIGDALLFLRPRRFGKTLWIRTLATYYDLRYRDEHEEIFGRLAIGREPTAEAHNYFVLHWNFSELEPHGTVEDLARELKRSTPIPRLNTAVREHLSPSLHNEAESRVSNA